MTDKPDIRALMATKDPAQAVQILAEHICAVAGIKPLSAGVDANKRLLLIEIPLGKRSFWVPMPLEAACNEPFNTGMLLSGICAAQAIEWFVAAPKPLIEVVQA